jgi:hypothetical protein
MKRFSWIARTGERLTSRYFPGWVRIAVVAFAFLRAPAGAGATSQGPCGSMSAAHVSVSIGTHELHLCEGGVTTQTFGVRLARSGAGKSREGDAKMPVGTYVLGRPRPSSQYGTFIPIGYPTAEQRRQGYTGGSLGIHGPDRRVRWLGRLVNTFDSTDGCVGIATDEQMESIAAWVRRLKASQIVLAIEDP